MLHNLTTLLFHRRASQGPFWEETFGQSLTPLRAAAPSGSPPALADPLQADAKDYLGDIRTDPRNLKGKKYPFKGILATQRGGRERRAAAQ